ncbi:IclR family transcriptional regulator [Streptomyces chartreusis]|uniref:IclR family transcriptional regulator n=1 Tax=Streptomyces chartreusis TaxID=1969 RepID=UPI002F90769A|nr:IclR family transcriptional regulator [Streptomyces chartreusis]WTA33458.1 IclR family transcriptional regulator [Streptomyces chartreusis]
MQQGARSSPIVEAADHVLTLLEILRRDNALHIHAAARELGVAPSTVHRLTQTLVFRGYAVRRPDRTYVPGPALPRSPFDATWRTLAGQWRPVLEDASRATGETVHLVVREGDSAVFLDSVVPSHALSVGSRAGTRLPAERNSGGKVLLAHLSHAVVRPLYAQRADVDVEALLGYLDSIRCQGFALSVAESERGITAIGVQARGAVGQPVAIAVSGPSARFDRRRALATLPALKEVVASASE